MVTQLFLTGRLEGYSQESDRSASVVVCPVFGFSPLGWAVIIAVIVHDMGVYYGKHLSIEPLLFFCGR
jgi:hypothetical protein